MQRPATLGIVPREMQPRDAACAREPHARYTEVTHMFLANGRGSSENARRSSRRGKNPRFMYSFIYSGDERVREIYACNVLINHDLRALFCLRAHLSLFHVCRQPGLSRICLLAPAIFPREGNSVPREEKEPGILIFRRLETCLRRSARLGRSDRAGGENGKGG